MEPVRTVTVTDPAGVSWRVRVRWTPRYSAFVRRFGGWRRGRRHRGDDALDVMDASDGVGQVAGLGRSGIPRLGFPDFFDDALGIVTAVAAVVFGAVLVFGLFWWLLIPLLLVVLDAVAVIVLLVLGIGARVLLRRPWSVDATSPGDAYETSVVGWHRALRARDGIAAGLGREGAAAWPALAARPWD
jgi:hypothetical protein